MANDNPLPPVPDAVQAALDRLDTTTLQTERQKAVDARLDVRGFDAALAKRQATPPDAAKLADIVAHNVSPSPQHGDYSKAPLGKLTEGMSAEQIAGVRQETSAWASALKFSPTIGNAVVERLATLGAELKAMEPVERADWAARQEEAAINRLAAKYVNEVPAKRTELAKAEFEKLKADAAKVLDRAPGDISKGLLDSPQFNDLWLLRTLVNHGHALQMIEAKYPK
jgi:uncharacterized protein HemY